MIKVSEHKIQDSQPSFILSKSFGFSKGATTKKNSLDKAILFSIIGLGLMFLWVLSTYLFTPQLIQQVVPAALLISVVLLLKAFEPRPNSLKK